MFVLGYAMQTLPSNISHQIVVYQVCIRYSDSFAFNSLINCFRSQLESCLLECKDAIFVWSPLLASARSSVVSLESNSDSSSWRNNRFRIARLSKCLNVQKTLSLPIKLDVEAWPPIWRLSAGISVSRLILESSMLFSTDLE
jgi:hypothetical protein